MNMPMIRQRLPGKRGIKNIFKSNGYINPEPLKKICEVLDAANIDLKAITDSTYLKLSGGKAAAGA